MSILLVIAIVVSFAIQAVVRRWWLGLLLSVLATQIAWAIAALLFALLTTHPIVAESDATFTEGLLLDIGVALCAFGALRLLRSRRPSL